VSKKIDPLLVTRWLTRLWSHVDKNGPRAGRLGRCWVWISGRTRYSKSMSPVMLRPRPTTGYGLYDGRPAHRVVYELANGPIPEWMHLHHKCENPLCVRPSHLEPYTNREHRALHHNSVQEARRKALRATIREADVKIIDVARTARISHAQLSEMLTGKKGIGPVRYRQLLEAAGAVKEMGHGR
jgi:hypothetical protein